MAGSSETRQEVSTEAGQAQPEPVVDLAMDVDSDIGESDDTAVDDGDGKVLFAKSTDIRRRIEERLEVKLLKDQLGMDDLDL